MRRKGNGTCQVALCRTHRTGFMWGQGQIGSTSAHLTIRSRGTAISQLRFYLQVARKHPIGFDILMLAGWMKEEMSMEPPVPTCDKI
jgi:hypothetical protein